ncbi:MAG: type I restriction enzyme HsdR N-terminal domain-containing protein [Deltaproteobacteria bacterium]|jgi:hypothetical protein|nr:type I restriction enzyme HsdR N-terminal domain-containing protein [Deltaproteobacteria bacterium]
MFDKIKQIANTYNEAKDKIQTEEATKNALIMPFIAALGFNVFNPLEVVPEIVADIGEKKGEKIDYALKSGDKVLMLVECKKCTSSLTEKNVSQVFRYFGALKVKMDVRVAVLTNGLVYQFFSDLDNGNVLDHVPFFTFDILDFDDQKIQDLQKFSKNQFDVDTIVAKAEELKRRAVVENLLNKYMTSPTESFVKCVLTDTSYEGIKTKDVVNSYAVIIKDAFSQLIKNRVESILKTAMKQDAVVTSQEAAEDAEISQSSGREIETTPEEFEGYAIVKSIVREIVAPSRIVLKDTKTYCSVTLDDDTSGYKPIIRFYFNNPTKKRIGVYPDVSARSKIQQYPINELDDIYSYAEQIKDAVRAYESGVKAQAADTGSEEEGE